jgi:hypothetical protein
MARRAGAANLFEREGFEAFVRALPATSLVRQWGDASVGKVGGKIFAIWVMPPPCRSSVRIWPSRCCPS